MKPTAPATVDELSPSDPLAPAVEWIRERGGIVPCARSTMLMSLSSKPKDLKAALKKAKAPAGVYAILNAEMYHRAKGKAEPEDGENWWDK